MKAVAYIRVSTADQKLSPATQRERIRKLCEAKGWTIAKTYIDKQTGRNDDRVAFQKAVNHACRRKYVLVGYSLSRLARSAGDAEKLCERLEAAGASLASCVDSIDTTTAMGKALFGVVAVFARLESDLISERVRAVNEDTVKRLGYRTQGRQPVGFKIVNGRRVPCERERALVARVNELASVLGPVEAARALEAAGESTINQLRKQADATGWTVRKVRHLMNKAPAGSAPHGLDA
jgi:DNA invertase Pin-like site-specific DNA recombinase